MSNRKRTTEGAAAARRTFLQAAALGGGLLSGGLVGPRLAHAQGGGEDVLQKAIKAKQLNIAVVIYPPLTQKQGGELSGTFIEAAKWLAKQMDVTPNFVEAEFGTFIAAIQSCLLYTSPSPRDRQKSRMPSSA